MADENIYYVNATDITQVILKEQEKAKLENEMEIAKVVQETLLVSKQISTREIEIATHYESSLKVGGDWLGVHYEETEKVAKFTLGDVTGHGFASGLLSGLACGSIMTSNWFNTPSSQNTTNHKITLEDSARALNHIFTLTGSKGGHAMTMLLFEIAIDSGIMTIVNAGHPQPIIFSPLHKKFKKFSQVGSILGFQNKPLLQRETVQLDQGDIVFAYTDGLVENINKMGKYVTVKSLRETLSNEEDVHKIKSEFVKKYEDLHFQSKTDEYDDVTFIAIRYRGIQS